MRGVLGLSGDVSFTTLMVRRREAPSRTMSHRQCMRASFETPTCGRLLRMRARAFSGEVDAGSPQKMRPLKEK